MSKTIRCAVALLTMLLRGISLSAAQPDPTVNESDLQNVSPQEGIATTPAPAGFQQPPPGVIPAPGGGYYYDYSSSCSDPCWFDSFWDFTGGRPPTDWACRDGYGPECEVSRVRGEWLLWFSSGRDTPVLGRFFSFLNNFKGDFGNDPIGENARNGARLTFSHLLGDGATWAEGRVWGVEDSSETFSINTSNARFIFQPYFNVQTGQFTFNPVSNLTQTGTLTIRAKNDLFGAEALLRRTWWDDGRNRTGLIGGYQFTRLDDSLSITTENALTVAAPPLPIGTQSIVTDLFQTQNQFHGAALGVMSEWRSKVWTFELLGKVGLGNMNERVVISGQNVGTLPNGATITLPAGFYAQPSNTGTHQRNRFAAVPELNVNFVYNISPSWRVLGGYSLIYWSEVVLAGNHIDPRLNLSQVPGPPVGITAPNFDFHRTGFVVQGLNLGVDYRW